MVTDILPTPSWGFCVLDESFAAVQPLLPEAGPNSTLVTVNPDRHAINPSRALDGNHPRLNARPMITEKVSIRAFCESF